MNASMVIDSSALLAVLLGEPEADRILAVMLDAHERWISSFNLLEASVVIAAKKGEHAVPILDALAYHLDVQVSPLTKEQTLIALDAWVRFGMERHSAALNLGDCCAYAAARALSLPLLAKGSDFPQTDIDLVDIR